MKRRLWNHPFSRYLCTLPLYDLLIWLLIMGNALAGAILPVFLGGLMLLGLIGGAIWGGVPGLRWRTFAAYSLLSLLVFPLPYMLFSASEPEWFVLTFVLLNGQQAVGFLLGAWCRMAYIREQNR